MTLLDLWLESQNAQRLLDTRQVEGRMEARIDGQGWFAPQWVPVPDDVSTFIAERASYRPAGGSNTRRRQ